MGGEVEIVLAGAPAGDGLARVEALFAAYEQAMSRFLPDSDLSALNRSDGRAYAASPVLFDAVNEAVGWACVTDGIFDPTMIDALEAAGYDRSFDELRGGVATTQAPVRPARGRWRGIGFDHERERITLPPGVRIDLGGIGKGYTVDRAWPLLGARPNALVNAAGDLYAAGAGPDGDGWYVGVADPHVPSADIALLRVRDRGVATSGVTKRHWGGGDARYHHLIDPRRGTSADSDLVSVTVVARTATEADVLAKTALLLGQQAGARFIDRFGAAWLAVTHDRRMILGERMREYVA